jgi:hypothetical protein
VFWLRLEVIYVWRKGWCRVYCLYFRDAKGQGSWQSYWISYQLWRQEILCSGCFILPHASASCPWYVWHYERNVFYVDNVPYMSCTLVLNVKFCWIYFIYVTSIQKNVCNQCVKMGCINLLKPSGNFTYHKIQYSIILHSAQIAFMCFVHISEQTATFAVNISNSFVFYNRGRKCLLRGTHWVFI